MVSLDVCGVAVDFPFQPYDSQLVYMEKVVQALSSKQNAILESPTGTGKTLCLLCATLGWRRHMEKSLAAGNGPAAVFAQRRQRQQLAYEDEDKREDDAPLLPRIIYSSRTHSQLKQVVQELKNTAYRPRVAVLGSREHLCVHDKVSQMRGTRQNLACRSTVKANKCQYKAGFDASVRRSKQSTLPIMDIEELVESMKEKHICPFFKTRSIVADAELVFVPYNYLIDPMARRSIGISLENAVLIFDEAHNVESIASEAASYALTSADITGCVSEVDQFIKALSDHQVVLGPGSSLNVESAQTLKALLLEIDKGLNNFPLSSSGGFTKPGQYIFEFFQQFNVNFDTCPLVLSMIEEIIEVANAGNDAQRAASKLDSLLSFLGTIFRDKEKHVQAAENYRVHIQEVQDKSSSGGRVFNSVRKNKSMRVFNYWCFHPGVSFQEICANNVYNVVLTSGTLSPLETTIKELGIEFPVRLENSHVIDANQVWVGVVGTGVTGKRLNSSYNFRSTDAYMIELGNTIVNFTRLVPKGLLVFFPSYTILEQSIERWQKPGEGESKVSIWDRILQQKAAFVEPRGRLDFKAVVDEYHETIADNPNGAVFFAVCRGKVSEGIDFSNDKGRAVVITGLPFPPTKDPKIVLKKGILDQAQVPPGQLKLTGNQWYIQQAARAVNQAIGRVIRHRHDYGAIILCDERFALPQQQNCLSKWLQPYCHPCRNYGEAHIGLTRFFKANKAAHPVVSQPLKSAGLSKKFISPVIPDPPSIASGTGDVQAQTSLRQILEEDTTGIGDGQSYVNPSLLRKPSTTSKQQAVAPPFASRLNTVPRQETVPRKRTLGSMLAANSAIMETTSSISRPFVAPRSRPTGSIASTAVQETSSSELSRQQSANDDSSTTGPAGAFPSIARRVLPAEQVSELYGYVRQLHANNDIEAALEGIIRLLESPSCQELVDLMPKLLGGTISARFVELARSHGLRVGAPALDGTENGESSRTDGPSMGGINSFFAKLQQTKRRRYHGSSEIPTAAVIKDPQCSVCYEITRKAYASRCGHICCLGCWKKMEKDGFTSCPLCKVPVKLDQLSLIRAAKAESTTAESH